MVAFYGAPLVANRHNLTVDFRTFRVGLCTLLGIDIQSGLGLAENG